MERIALAFSPLRDASPRDIVSWSRDAAGRGYGAVFIPESYCDSLAYAEAVALATSRLRVGTGVTNIYLRQPTLLAAEAAAVQELSGGRLLLGVGVGHRAVNEPLGVDMSDPVGTMRSVIGTLRAAWTKGPTQPRPAAPPVRRSRSCSRTRSASRAPRPWRAPLRPSRRAEPLKARKAAATVAVRRDGLPGDAQPAAHRIPDARQPRPARAGDPPALGRHAALREAPRGECRPSTLRAARRTAVRQRQHPHRPHAQQGAEGRHREAPRDGRPLRALRARVGLPRAADRARGGT